MFCMRRVVIAIRGTTHSSSLQDALSKLQQALCFNAASTGNIYSETLHHSFGVPARKGSLYAIHYCLTPADSSLKIDTAQVFFVTAFH